MKTVLIVLCHPNPRSFNHAIATAVRRRLDELGCAVVYHDLYEEGFDPVLNRDELARRFSFDGLVQRHYRDIEEADGIVIVHPEWWSQPPALLKGWIDRVIRPGIGYEFEGEEFMPKSKVALLGGKRALVLATTDAEPPEAIVESGEEPPTERPQPLLASLWRETLGYCGITDFHFRMLYAVRTVEPADRRQWLGEAVRLAGELFSPSSESS